MSGLARIRTWFSRHPYVGLVLILLAILLALSTVPALQPSFIDDDRIDLFGRLTLVVSAPSVASVAPKFIPSA